nr:hypothetical protein [Parachlamydiaceae bacterium]
DGCFKALDDFSQLLERVPNHVKGLYGASCCLDALKRKEEAKAMLIKALEFEPDFEGARSLLDRLNG